MSRPLYKMFSLVVGLLGGMAASARQLTGTWPGEGADEPEPESKKR